MADPLVISILISVLVVFLVCTVLCRYRHRICRRRGAASEGEVHVPLCTQIAMDMCCVEISNWRDLFEFQHLLLRRFLTALDFAFGLLMVLLGCVSMGDSKTRNLLCIYLIFIGAALIMFELSSRLFSFDAKCRKLFGFMYGCCGRVTFFTFIGAMCVVVDTFGFILAMGLFGVAFINWATIRQNPNLFAEIYDMSDFDDPSAKGAKHAADNNIDGKWTPQWVEPKVVRKSDMKRDHPLDAKIGSGYSVAS